MKPALRLAFLAACVVALPLATAACKGEKKAAEAADAEGEILPKWARSGARLTEKPCIVTQRRMRTPIAPIFASRPSTSVVQMPMRPSRRKLSTPKCASVDITQPSSAWTKPRASRARRLRSSRT